VSHDNGNNNQHTASAASKLGRQIQRVLLLVTVVIGAVGAFWIWEHYRTQKFEVVLVTAPDPHEILGGYPYDAEELIERMDFTAWPSQDGPLLELKSKDEPQTWTFGVKGEDRQSIKAQNLRGALTWRGSDVEGLTIPLNYPVESTEKSGRYELTLRTGAVEDFYEDAIITTTFKVVDRNTHASLPGLTLDGLEVRGFDPVSPGIYEVSVDAGMLLDLERGQIDSLAFRVTQTRDERAAENLSLSVPLAWFFNQPTATELRVLAVDFVTEIDPLCPRATGLQPRSVQQNQWPGSLVVTGEFLDRTRSASLKRGNQAMACTIVRATPTRLELATESAPDPGAYELTLQSDGCGPTTGGRLQVLTAVTALRALPLATTDIEAGGPMTIRWQRGSTRGPLVVEVSGPGGAGPWRALADVSAEANQHTWPAVDLGPGSHKLRLRSPDNNKVLASWNFLVVAPSKMLVVLHFADGAKNWRIREAWVDGREIAAGEMQATGSHARITLAPGEHRWVAKGRDGVAYTGSFNVESHHQFQEGGDFELIRLDRVESRRRD